MSSTQSSNRWVKQHCSVSYVKRAQKEGFRSRSAYKLLEIQEKTKLIKSGMTIVDLGAAPGGWSQLASRIVGSTGKIYALDILPMEALTQVEFLQGDFREESIMQQLLQHVQSTPIDLVISDMAPNFSGVRSVDQPRSIYLAELALEFARKVLKPKGCFIVKIFQGEGFEAFLRDLRNLFERVTIRKPSASRNSSAEIYLVAKGYHAEIKL